MSVINGAGYIKDGKLYKVRWFRRTEVNDLPTEGSNATTGLADAPKPNIYKGLEES